MVHLFGPGHFFVQCITGKEMRLFRLLNSKMATRRVVTLTRRLAAMNASMKSTSARRHMTYAWSWSMRTLTTRIACRKHGCVAAGTARAIAEAQDQEEGVAENKACARIRRMPIGRKDCGE